MIQVLLSIAAFCFATDNPVLLLVAGMIAAASWHLTHGPRGRTLPMRWLNLCAAAATLSIFWRVYYLNANLLVAMGHFTLVLQLLLLYAHKTVREYAQLLVISVLQMVGASVLGVSMAYAVLLLAYCTLGMATLILFHLRTVAQRVSAEHTAAGVAGGGAPRPRFNHTASRGARAALRRVGLSGLMVTAAVTLAVFVGLPRTEQARSNAAFRSGPRINSARSTGFSPEVQLGNGPIGSGSHEPVLHLRIRDGEMNLGSVNAPWLIRGMALDDYDPEDFLWRRSTLNSRAAQPVPPHGIIHRDTDIRRGHYSAQITVRRGSPSIVFGVVTQPTADGGPGFRPQKIIGAGLPRVTYSTLDQQLSSLAAIPAGASYQLNWPRATALFNRPATDRHPAINPPGIAAWARWQAFTPRIRTPHDAWSHTYRNHRLASVTPDTYARAWTPRIDKVRDTAMQVIRAAGLERDPTATHDPHDARVAAALSRHLSSQYAYSLSNPAPPTGHDPVTHFLFETRNGHCELFAAGLVALCRSVGIPARMVVGFRASEYSELGGYYVVRQSHAHAWAEVDAGPGIGWITLDATPAAPVAAHHAATSGALAAAARFWEYLEFNWIRKVVGFDQHTRNAALNTLSHSGSWIKDLSIQATRPLKARWSTAVRRFNPAAFVAAVVTVGIGLLLIVLLARTRQRARAPRRGHAAGTGAAPPAFYIHMQTLLHQGGIRRRPGQTPRAFARQVANDHPLLHDALPALTETYYAVRFGGQNLDADARRTVEAQLQALQQALPPADAATSTAI